MARKPFEFAAPLEDLISEEVRGEWPETSTAQCTVDGKQYCVQDDLAQVVLRVNQKKVDEFGAAVPTTWQEWAALGEQVAAEHPGYIVGNIGVAVASVAPSGSIRQALMRVEPSSIPRTARPDAMTSAVTFDPIRCRRLVRNLSRVARDR
jgi:hypothetical protein